MLKRLLICCTLLLAPLALAQENTQPNPQVVIKTSEGDITLRLFRDKAPLAVDNFLAYVDAGFYNGTIFHRVIPNFMVQGGGFLPDMTEKATGEPVVNESSNRVHNTRGTIAMARTSDPDSATSQFFINQRNNLELDWAPGKEGYTVFGEVILGMNVVDFMATAPTAKVGSFSDVPVQPIVIKEIVRKKLL
ncbi:MAG: peptidyl-prolyl cis-trans isomerase [Pseudomonadales bacterium]|nr:peptidyl-prolyl cis-trans isomerase [Halioglobus sp.]MCP5131230.1 peptidyl-prolyl cis-trans isomerase [Pseudomonadales bacterium]